jgi:hypothetical protein
MWAVKGLGTWATKVRPPAPLAINQISDTWNPLFDWGTMTPLTDGDSSTEHHFVTGSLSSRHSKVVPYAPLLAWDLSTFRIQLFFLPSFSMMSGSANDQAPPYSSYVIDWKNHSIITPGGVAIRTKWS